MWNKLVKVKPSVQRMLKEFPETRNSDELLILKIWALQNPELRKHNFLFVNFAKAWMDGKLANAESIRRSRQKLQEDHPELRGRSYVARGEADDEVRENIKNL